MAKANKSKHKLSPIVQPSSTIVDSSQAAKTPAGRNRQKTSSKKKEAGSSSDQATNSKQPAGHRGSRSDAQPQKSSARHEQDNPHSEQERQPPQAPAAHVTVHSTHQAAGKAHASPLPHKASNVPLSHQSTKRSNQHTGKHASQSKQTAQKQPASAGSIPQPGLISNTEPLISKKAKKSGGARSRHLKKAALTRKAKQGGVAVTAAAPVAPAPPPRLHAATAQQQAQAVAVSSNWEVMKQAVGATGEGLKRKREAEEALAAAGGKRPSSKGTSAAPTPVIAMDCEMVGVGRNGERSALARVAIINNEGNVLLDEHVKPKERVTDYRTRWSGIRPSDLQDAPPFDEVIARVAALLKGRTVVGHALHNDLAVLMLGHPKKDIRDTARYPPLMRAGAVGRKPKPQALRILAAAQLGLCIQEGEHTPVDDARAALYLYHKHHKDWEAALARGTLHHPPAASTAIAATTVTKVVSKAGEALRTRVVKAPAAAVPGAVSAGRAVAGAAAHHRIHQQANGTMPGALKPGKRQPGSDPFSRSVFEDPMADL